MVMNAIFTIFGQKKPPRRDLRSDFRDYLLI